MSGFVMVPEWLLAKQPSGNAMLAYLNLARRGTFRPGPGTYEECRPALATLAADMGISVSTAQRALEELARLGAIRKRLRFDERGGKLPTAYTVIFGQVVEPAPPQVTGDQRGVVMGDQRDYPPMTEDPEPNTKNKEGGPPSSAPPRARTRDGVPTRLPEDFPVTDEMKTWARANAPNCGTEDHEEFCDYWRALAGVRARKTDWLATWRNWMRKANREKYRRPVGAQFKTAYEKRQELAVKTGDLISEATALVKSRGGDPDDNREMTRAMAEIKAARGESTGFLGALGSMLKADTPKQLELPQ